MFSHTPLGPGPKGLFYVTCSVLFVSCFYAVRHCWREFQSTIVFRGFIANYRLCCTTSAKTIRSNSQSKAVKRLRAYNQSPEKESAGFVVTVLAVREVGVQWWSKSVVRQLESSHWIALTGEDHRNFLMIPRIGLKSCFCCKRSTESSLNDWKRNLLQNLIRRESARWLNPNLNSKVIRSNTK